LEPRYFEDISVGEKYITPERTITETDIVNFVCLAGISEPLFRSIEHVKRASIYERRIAPAPLTYAISIGLTQEVPLYKGALLAMLGVDEFRMPHPLFCNDTIHVEMEIIEKKETKNPARGIIRNKRLIKNQKDEIILHYIVTSLVKRREQPS